MGRKALHHTTMQFCLSQQATDIVHDRRPDGMTMSEFVDQCIIQWAERETSNKDQDHA
jgi:hypothetical protein